MTDLERRDVQYLLDALKRAEWSDIRDETAKCPVCRRPRAWGHVCSCILGLAIRKVGPRLMGAEPPTRPENTIDLGNINDAGNLKALAARIRSCSALAGPNVSVRVPPEHMRDELAQVADAMDAIEELMR